MIYGVFVDESKSMGILESEHKTNVFINRHDEILKETAWAKSIKGKTRKAVAAITPSYLKLISLK